MATSDVAPTVSARTKGGGGLGTDFDCDGGLIASEGPVSGTVSSKWAKGSGGPAGNECQNLVAQFPTELSGAQAVSKDAHVSDALAVTHTQAVAIQERAVSENVEAGPQGAGFNADGAAYTLESRGKVQAVAFGSKDHGADASIEVAPTLRSGGHDGSHANAGVPPAVAYGMRGRDDGAQLEGPHDTANLRASEGGSSRSYIQQEWSVRRLMPVECERLQGFPDGYTAIAWRGKPADDCPDGPRYKALGNSMAVNVMRWIGERIDLVEGLG